MSNQSVTDTLRCTRVRENPKFNQLVRTRSRLTWGLSFLVLGSYCVFMAIVAFSPEWLHTPLTENSVLTTGIPAGAAIILFSWLVTGWYVYRANTSFDVLGAAVLEESL